MPNFPQSSAAGLVLGVFVFTGCVFRLLYGMYKRKKEADASQADVAAIRGAKAAMDLESAGAVTEKNGAEGVSKLEVAPDGRAAILRVAGRPQTPSEVMALKHIQHPLVRPSSRGSSRSGSGSPRLLVSGDDWWNDRPPTPPRSATPTVRGMAAAPRSALDEFPERPGTTNSMRSAWSDGDYAWDDPNRPWSAPTKEVEDSKWWEEAREWWPDAVASAWESPYRPSSRNSNRSMRGSRRQARVTPAMADPEEFQAPPIRVVARPFTSPVKVASQLTSTWPKKAQDLAPADPVYVVQGNEAWERIKENAKAARVEYQNGRPPPHPGPPPVPKMSVWDFSNLPAEGYRPSTSAGDAGPARTVVTPMRGSTSQDTRKREDSSRPQASHGARPVASQQSTRPNTSPPQSQEQRIPPSRQGPSPQGPSAGPASDAANAASQAPKCRVFTPGAPTWMPTWRGISEVLVPGRTDPPKVEVAKLDSGRPEERIAAMTRQLDETRHQPPAERKRIFRELQRQLHPDKNVDAPEDAKLVFQELMELRQYYLNPCYAPT